MEDTITQDTPSNPAATHTATQAVAPGAPREPTVTPTASPATAIPVAPTATPDAPPATFGEPITYPPTGDANLDMVMGFIGKHGLSLEHPAIVAADDGDFGPIRALLAEKGVQGADAYLALAEKSMDDLRAREDAHIQSVQQIVLQAAGGDEAAWEDTLAWASANADPAEKDAVNDALEQGGVVAEAVAAFLVNQYRNASGTSYSPTASVVRPDAARGAANPSVGALSPADYGKAVADLRRTKGAYFDQTPDYRQLQARRAAWRG